jgi:hypothetical protein
MLGYAISLKYMFAGYAVIFTILAIYIISLLARWRNLKRDLNSLDEIKKN